MDTIKVRGTSYELRSDGLFYKELILQNSTFNVPMYVSRNRAGWRVRIKLSNDHVIREYFMDGSQARLSDLERIQASLDKAIFFIKTHLVGNPNDPTLKYQKRVRSKRVIPGVYVKAETCPGISKSPIVRISAKMPGQNRLIKGATSSLSIFSCSEKEIRAEIARAKIIRDLCVDIYNSGKKVPDDPLGLISPTQFKELHDGVEFSFNPYELIIHSIEEKVDLSSFCYDNVHTLEVSSKIIVDRVSKQPGEISERRLFSVSEFSSLELAQRVAKLYAAYLTVTKPKALKTFAF